MNTAAARDSWVGRVIDGRFTLLQWLGSSGWSHVFLTELEGPGSQKAAIKLMSAVASDSQAYVSRWQVATTLSHPHLMRLFHIGHYRVSTAQLIYAVMEYAEEDLSQILPERPLTPTEAREMLQPVLDTLSYLHEKGFVHGHLKPSNIMVVENRLKLSCDSLHVAGAQGKRLPAPGFYDAPEFSTGAISPAADVWSLGVTLVEALTQRLPAWHSSLPREPVLPESIPPPFADIAQECLRSDPARRCTLADIKARLDLPRSLPESGGDTHRKSSAKLRVTALIATALVLFAVIAALKLGSRRAGPSLPTEQQQPAPAVAALPPQSQTPPNRTAKSMVVKGSVADRLLPEVPRRASKTIQGRVKVRIRVTVDPSGDVSSAKFDSAGPSKYFANLALQSARHWKFRPAQVDGQAVSSVWMLRFQFGQTATEVTPVEVSP
jgi:TonB family protein